MRRLMIVAEAVRIEPTWFLQGQPISTKGNPSELETVNDDVLDILEPEEWSWEWRRTMVPLTDIDDYPYQTKKRLNLVRSQDKWLPIIARLELNGRARLLDGGHRLHVAKERGIKEIDTLVGRPRPRKRKPIVNEL